VLPNCYNTYPTFALQVTSNDPNFAYQSQYAAQGTADTYVHAFRSNISAAKKLFLDYYGLLISNVLGPGRGAIPYRGISGGGIANVGAYAPGVQVLQCEIANPALVSWCVELCGSLGEFYLSVLRRFFFGEDAAM
jgi:hypothetical protein